MLHPVNEYARILGSHCEIRLCLDQDTTENEYGNRSREFLVRSVTVGSPRRRPRVKTQCNLSSFFQHANPKQNRSSRTFRETEYCCQESFSLDSTQANSQYESFNHFFLDYGQFASTKVNMRHPRLIFECETGQSREGETPLSGVTGEIAVDFRENV